MKTKLNYLLIAFVATTLCIGNSFGQSNRKSGVVTSFEYGDKLANTKNDGSLAESRVSKRTLNAFSNSFPNANDAKWNNVGKKYSVDFIKTGKQYKCLYDAKGNLIYSLFYGSEKDLPSDVRRIVKREYIDYEITQAVEANEDNRHVWIINLNGDKNFVSVAVEDGSLGELSNFKKAQN